MFLSGIQIHKVVWPCHDGGSPAGVDVVDVVSDEASCQYQVGVEIVCTRTVLGALIL